MEEYEKYRLRDYVNVPQGGYRADFPKTGLKLSSDDYSGLVESVKIHLASNGYDETESERLVEMSTVKYLFSRNLWSYLRKLEVSRTVADYWKGSKYYLAMIDYEKRGVSPLCELYEAENRAQVCVKCPYNVEISKSKLNDATERLFSKRIGDRTLSVDGDLKGCGVCKCKLSLKAHVSDEILLSVERGKNYNYPPHCWMNHLRK